MENRQSQKINIHFCFQGKKLPANLDPDAEEGDVSDEDTGEEDEDEDDEETIQVRYMVSLIA